VSCRCRDRRRCTRCVPVHPNYIQRACDCRSGVLCRYCDRWLTRVDRWLPLSVVTVDEALAVIRRVFPDTRVLAGEGPAEKENNTWPICAT
jgi:hypothetical protein